jgi:hypothetical protein
MPRGKVRHAAVQDQVSEDTIGSMTVLREVDVPLRKMESHWLIQRTRITAGLKLRIFGNGQEPIGCCEVASRCSSES